MVLIMALSAIPLAGAVPYKETFTCIEDPLFHSCVLGSPVNCNQIFGGTDTNFCADASGAGGAGLWAENGAGTLLIINDSETTATGINVSQVWTDYIYNFFDSNCSVGNYLQGINSDGSYNCSVPAGSPSGGGSSKAGSPPWLYNTTTHILFNFTFALGNFSQYFMNRTDWTSIDDYPAPCSAGYFMSGIGDTLTCNPDINTYNTTEEMQDAVGAAFNHTLVYDDAGDSMGVNITWLDESYYNKSYDFKTEAYLNKSLYTQVHANNTFVRLEKINITHYTQTHANATFVLKSTINLTHYSQLHANATFVPLLTINKTHYTQAHANVTFYTKSYTNTTFARMNVTNHGSFELMDVSGSTMTWSSDGSGVWTLEVT